jgi:hypothetical protein
VIAGGTVKAQSKRPIASVTQVLGSLTLVPSKVRVMGLCGAKPAPPTGSLLPTTPESGFRPMPGRRKSLASGLVAVPEFVSLAAAAFVKVTEAEFVVLSDAVTAWGPAAATGTVNAQKLKLPVASAGHDVATLLPSKVTVMVPWGTKPRPLTAALLPTGPLRRIRLMPGLTVSVAISIAPGELCACAPRAWGDNSMTSRVDSSDRVVKRAS